MEDSSLSKSLMRGQIKTSKNRFKLAIFSENTKIFVLEGRLSAAIAGCSIDKKFLRIRYDNTGFFLYYGFIDIDFKNEDYG